MEGHATELFKEELRKFTKTTEELLLKKNSVLFILEEDPAQTEKCTELSKEREKLLIRLEELKKENFSLRASLKAWQLTLKSKLDEFDEADLTLNKIYNEIWAERESFCVKAEKFSEEHGVLSAWWNKQMKFDSDVDKIEREGSQEVHESQGEDWNSKKQSRGCAKEEAEVEEDFTEEGDLCGCRGRKVLAEELDRLKTWQMKEKTEAYREEVKPTKDDLFSIVDLEKVRMANRMKQRRCKNPLLKGMKSH